jgi:hypothetical protein
MDLFLFYLAVSVIVTSGLIIYFREHLRKQIGWYLLGMLTFMVVTNFSEYWWMMFFSLVVFLQVPPFSVEEKLLTKAANSDNRFKRWQRRKGKFVQFLVYILCMILLSAFGTWLSGDGNIHFILIG